MRRVVGDLMTKDVIVVRESTLYKEVVDLMPANDVSAVPVVDENGHLAGIVSEADLLLKEEHRGREAEHHRFERGRRRVERTKASGQVARDLMVTSVVSVRPDAAPGEAARLMHEHGVKRLPVIDEHDHMHFVTDDTGLRPPQQLPWGVLPPSLRRP